MAADFTRYRFSVPLEDTSVREWIDAQANLSHSLRTLIRDSIRKHGMMDATCLPVEQIGKVGRPSNAELAARKAAEQEVETPVEPTPPLVVPKPEPKVQGAGSVLDGDALSSIFKK